MKNERQLMTIKEWLYRKINDQALDYQMMIDVFNRDENGMIPNDEVKVLVEEVLAESEKAIKVRLATGEVDGSYKGWVCWIAKSCIYA